MSECDVQVMYQISALLTRFFFGEGRGDYEVISLLVRRLIFDRNKTKSNSTENPPLNRWYLKIVLSVHCELMYRAYHQDHHHHKHQGLDPLIRSVSRVTGARANASSVFQLFSFLVVCSGMISKGFGFVAFCASVEASSVCIHLSCLVCL